MIRLKLYTDPMIPELSSLFNRHRLKQIEPNKFEFPNIGMYRTLEAIQVDLELIGYEYHMGKYMFTHKRYPRLIFHTEPLVLLEIK